MKLFAKLALALTLACSFLNVAVASEGYYGEPKKLLKSSGQDVFGYVTIYNHTFGSYFADAVFYGSGKPLTKVSIGPMNSGTDIFTYSISHPDTAVSVEIYYFDQFSRKVDVMPSTLFPAGNRIDIGRPPLANGVAAKDSKPTVTISNQ